MASLYPVIGALYIYDFIILYKSGRKKEIVVYTVLSAMAIGLNWFYISDPLRKSFVSILFSLFNIKG